MTVFSVKIAGRDNREPYPDIVKSNRVTSFAHGGYYNGQNSKIYVTNNNIAYIGR